MDTKRVKRKNIEEVLKASNRTIARALHRRPPVRMQCSVLAEDALKWAMRDYLSKSKEKDDNNKDEPAS